MPDQSTIDMVKALLGGANQFVDKDKLSRVPVPTSLPDAAYANAYANRFNELPVSTNIDDRRNEIGLNALLQSWTSLTPEDWATALKHPMTPYWDLFPRAKGGENKDSQVAIEAGINSIGSK